MAISVSSQDDIVSLKGVKKTMLAVLDPELSRLKFSSSVLHGFVFNGLFWSVYRFTFGTLEQRHQKIVFWESEAW